MAEPEPWPVVPLSEVANEVTVGFVGPMTSEYRVSGVPFLRSQNVKPLRIEVRGIEHISWEFHERIAKSRLGPGDVVIVRTGAPGTCAVVPDSLSIANCADLVVVRPGPNLNPHYLAYFVNFIAQHHVYAYSVGAVQQHFNVSSAKALPIPVPPRRIQDGIVASVAPIDGKIELNRGMNRTLEAMAQTLFRSWFVDFEPVSAKAAGRQPFGREPDAVLVSPDHFESSAAGPVPVGWRAVPFSILVDILGGGTPKTDVSAYWDGDIPWFSVVDTPAPGDLFVLRTEQTITQEGLDESAARLLGEGTTIITARGTIGNLALVGRPMAMNQSCYGLAGKSGYGSFFVYFATRELVEELQLRAHGSVFDTITRATFDSVTTVLPTPMAAARFDSVVAPLMARVRANLEESATLAALRDTLLPRLLSGEIRLREAEKLAGQAGA